MGTIHYRSGQPPHHLTIWGHVNWSLKAFSSVVRVFPGPHFNQGATPVQMSTQTFPVVFEKLSMYDGMASHFSLPSLLCRKYFTAEGLSHKTIVKLSLSSRRTNQRANTLQYILHCPRHNQISTDNTIGRFYTATLAITRLHTTERYQSFFFTL